MKIWLRFLLRSIDRCLSLPEEKVDDEARSLWLQRQFGDSGFRAYFRSRDWALLKAMGGGLPEKEYWVNVGRRMELLYLLGRIKEETDKAEKVHNKKPVDGRIDKAGSRVV